MCKHPVAAWLALMLVTRFAVAAAENTGDLTRVVLSPDGKIVEGATAMVIQGGFPVLRNGVLARHPGGTVTVYRTNAAGSFTVPTQKGGFSLVIIHDAGWWGLSGAQGAASGKSTLQAWCIVRGRVVKGGKPWPGQTVRLMPKDEHNRGLEASEDYRRMFVYESTTKDDGTFSFDRVIGGNFAAGLDLGHGPAAGRYQDGLSYVSPIALGDGENKRLEIDANGRPVKGKFVIPAALRGQERGSLEAQLLLLRPEFLVPENWESLDGTQRRTLRETFQQSEVCQAYECRVQRFGVPVAADGSFRMDDVPGGVYSLWGSISQRADGNTRMWETLASASRLITIADIPGGRSTEPLDLHQLELKMHGLPQVGDIAPEIDAPAFSGARVKLSNYRGKYVLLDYWATWCVPCVAGMKHLEELHDTYGKSDRLVIIGLSEDTQFDVPAAFLKARKLPWPQAHVGLASGSSACEDYGIRGIPSLWLISPDGKIVAKGIDAVDEALRKAIGDTNGK
ncbi:MAG: TlpA family protein disulfide reductase [Tepidisphaerales bacterium]